MKGFIAAAGISARLQDLGDRQNKTLLDLGGETLLGTVLNQFQRAGLHETCGAIGFEASSVHTSCYQRASFLLIPFFTHTTLSRLVRCTEKWKAAR